jgi:hypothetical protein
LVLGFAATVADAGAESGSDNDGEGEIDDITPHREFLEFFDYPSLA